MRNKIDIQNAIALLHGEGYTVTEPSIVAERAVVTELRNYGFDGQETMYQFSVEGKHKALPLSSIQSVIESVLNDTVVEDSGNGLKEVLGWINSAINAKEKFPDEVDFDFTLKTLKDQTEQYLKSLSAPLQQVQEDKPKVGDLIGNATVTKVEQVDNDKGKDLKCAIEVGMQIEYTTNKNWDMLGRKPYVTVLSIPGDFVKLSDNKTLSIGGFLDNIKSGRYKLLGNIYKTKQSLMNKVYSKPVDGDWIEEFKAKDKPFVWDDKLVIEYSQQWARDRKIPSLAIELFKQSKQSPTNLQESNAYQCYLKDCDCKGGGFILHEGVAVCRWCRKSYGKGGMINYLPEHFAKPQPSTTVKDKQDYKILTFEGVYGQLLHLDKQNFKYRSETSSISDIDFLMKYYKIKSVQRLSDNCVFSVGEKVNCDNCLESFSQQTIEKFQITDKGFLIASCPGVATSINNISKLPTPTEKATDTPLPKEELMYNSFSIHRIHPKNDSCDALGCVKYDERIHK